uniref:BTB domain-containing protein n=1 Tax=Plectus sambesii TaxID=2011161 RepID=A0A914VWB9_9BILA
MLDTKPIKLSVGGIRYETTAATLTSVEGSMLATMFSGRWPLPLTSDGCILIDRNGEAFAFVLTYLRGNNDGLLPTDRNMLDQLRDEAAYFNLPGLLTQIDAHDMNSRRVVLVYYSLIPYQPSLEYTFTISQLRRERYSILAITIDHHYQLKQTARLLKLHLGSRVDDYQYSYTTFEDFGSQINIENGPFGPNFLLIKRGKMARNYIIQCALKSLEVYLKTGDFAVELSASLFEKELEQDFESFLEVNADIEGGLNWITVRNMIDQQAIVERILIPAVISVAQYFGLTKLAHCAKAYQAQLQPNC